VRKTFDAEEVELLEKRTEDVLCFRSFEKKFKIKNGRSCFQSEKRYHTLRRYLPGNISHGCCRTYHYVNPSWCQISGLSFQEALGMVNAVHGDDKAAIINGWQNATTINEKLMSEYRFMRPDGKIAWVMGHLFLS
jgi:PAS domain S-box-containing protein